MERPMRNQESEFVYDPFLGSGTSVIAAERAGRRCLGLEINPKYCDIVVERYIRWCNENGIDATVNIKEAK
jgi:DNA modification methylase